LIHLRFEFLYYLFHISIFGADIYTSCVTGHGLRVSSLYTHHFTATSLLTNCSHHPCSSSALHCTIEVEVTLQLTVSQSVSQSVCQGIEPALGLVTRYYFLSEGCFLKVAVLSLWGALSDERSGLSFVFLSLVIHQYLHKAFTFHVFYSSAIYIQYISSFIQTRLSTADYALLVILSSNHQSILGS
jgi:hypothetical protein